MGNLNKWQEEQRSVEKAKVASKAQSASPPRSLSKRPSWASPSPLSEDSPAVVVSRESPATSMRRPALFSDPSSRTLSVTQSPTLNTPRERPSPLSTLSMLSRDKAALSTASAADCPQVKSRLNLSLSCKIALNLK